MVDLGPGQGRKDFATPGVSVMQWRENAGPGRKMAFLDGH